MSWPPVPDGRLLVLGDNRPNSCDAHLWKPDAFVPESSVIGQAEVIYWPPQHVGFLD
jgi:signal peptidase I